MSEMPVTLVCNNMPAFEALPRASSMNAGGGARWHLYLSLVENLTKVKYRPLQGPMSNAEWLLDYGTLYRISLLHCLFHSLRRWRLVSRHKGQALKQLNHTDGENFELNAMNETSHWQSASHYAHTLYEYEWAQYGKESHKDKQTSQLSEWAEGSSWSSAGLQCHAPASTGTQH